VSDAVRKSGYRQVRRTLTERHGQDVLLAMGVCVFAFAAYSAAERQSFVALAAAALAIITVALAIRIHDLELVSFKILALVRSGARFRAPR
jgi:hypothetical protein